MYETLVKTHEPTNFSLPTVDEAIARITAVEQKKELRRAGQIEDARRKKEGKELKRKRDEDSVAGAKAAAEGEPAGKVAVAVAAAEAGGEAVWRVKEAGRTTAESSPAPSGSGSGSGNARLPKEQRASTFRQGDLSRGHTSYLTFAVLLPVKQAAEEVADEVADEVAVVAKEGEASELGEETVASAAGGEIVAESKSMAEAVDGEVKMEE